ncbi:MAG: lipocalin family protein [Bacteroidaceae bacterium]|nr:lipocalin family protein [Bacteroidaceae bacterium]
MKQLKNLSIFMLVALMAATFASCSKDDDDANFDLNSYIIGTWHSYKATIYIQGGPYSGKSADIEVNKTGQYSQSYVEFTFKDGGQMRMGAFQKDDNGIINWTEENGTYYISGDIITLRDNDGETVNIVFDPKNKDLCIQGTGVDSEGTPYKTTAYLKK